MTEASNGLMMGLETRFLICLGSRSGHPDQLRLGGNHGSLGEVFLAGAAGLFLLWTALNAGPSLGLQCPLAEA